MEELKSVNYENTPVMFKEELPEGAVRLSSKHGQQYQCSYPDKVTKEKQEEKEKIAMETGIPELLKPMEEGPCLHYSQGWWDYEFCYGKHIRQFHTEGGHSLTDDAVPYEDFVRLLSPQRMAAMRQQLPIDSLLPADGKTLNDILADPVSKNQLLPEGIIVSKIEIY